VNQSVATVADQLAECLVAHGYRQVFAVTGGGAMFLNHALASHPQLTVTFMHHEQACAMAAEGYARINGGPAVVNVTSGPGGLNALNGVFGAYTDSIPMLVISGQVKRQTSLSFVSVPGLRQLGDQEARIVDIVQPITKGAWAVGSAGELGALLPEAAQLAIQGRPGPVWLDIPIDIQSSREPIIWSPSSAVATQAVADASPLAQAIAGLVALLKKASRPLVLAGTGVRLAKAERLLLDLVEAAQIPLATAWTHDLIESSHPLFAGRPGTIGTRAGNMCLQAADLVVVLGSRLNIRQVSYNWDSFASNAHIVQVDIDPAELSKPLVQPDTAILSDAASFLRELTAALRLPDNQLPSYAAWIAWCQTIRQRYPACEPSNISAEGIINPYHAIMALFACLPDTAIIVCGNASACILPFQVGELRSEQRLFSNSGSASMGYELPAAIGAAIAALATLPTGRKVICIAGDGSLQMNLQEMQTLKTLNLDISIVVLANNGYLSIRQSHQNFFKSVIGADDTSGVDCPDYVAIARAFGLRACAIRQPSELSAFSGLLSQAGPQLIEIHVDPLQGFSPKLKSRLDVNGMFLTPELDDLFPFLPVEELQSVRESARSIAFEVLKS